MKTYGKPREHYARRKIRGTSMACPCCVSSATVRRSLTKVYKKSARQDAKAEIRNEA